MKVEIPIHKNLCLTEIRESDKPHTLSLLADGVVAATLSLPEPYTEQSADYWIQLNLEDLKNGRTHHFAIRDETGQFLGCCGFNEWDGITKTHKSSIGYWLGEPYWGKGIATEVVKKLVSFGFETLKLERIWAYVFEGNIASERVLQKAGFKKEGVARKEFYRRGRYLDGILYAIVKGDSHP